VLGDDIGSSVPVAEGTAERGTEPAVAGDARDES
jgi:hypothetical protein